MAINTELQRCFCSILTTLNALTYQIKELSELLTPTGSETHEQSSEQQTNQRKRNVVSNIERLKCYPEVLKMLLPGKTKLLEVLNFILSKGEKSSHSALGRYSQYLRETTVYENDGTCIVTEQSGKKSKINLNDLT